MLDGATAFLRQATLADNSAANGGAIALENSATATILQSTIVENEASANGGGLKISSSYVLMHNTLVADNAATTAYPDVDGTLLAESSYNLISDGTGMSGISDGSQGNQVGTAQSPIDALLGTLGDHGGPVQTVPLRVESPALDAGSEELAVTRLGRSSSVVYDWLGRVVQQIATDPDGIGSQEAAVTTYAFDANGNLLAETDPLGSVTTYAYDHLARKTSETNAESGVTSYTYDAASRMTSLTDPEENTTYWSYGPLGQVATETINVSSTDLTRSFSYDSRGNLVRKVDRNGRVIDYAFDALSRQTTETWYDDVTDADAQQNVRKTYATEYDAAGRVAAVGDGDYDFAYTWSIFGNLTSTIQDLYGLTDDVAFSYAYDVLARKTGVSASIGSTDDYVNSYWYDTLGRITQITQEGVSGGNAVAEKRVDFAYSDDGTRATISRYADLAGTKAVAETEQIFDLLGRVTDIVHERAATEFADYDLTWDAAGRITDIDFDFLGSAYDDDASYTYDDTSQLTDADYTTQTDEDYDYDANGNRTLVDGTESYTTGDHNRLTSDGTYTYTYDNEGNVLTKTNISTSQSVEYTWDHRNRLVKITFKNSGGVPTKIVEYAYDHGQRWVRKTLDTNADGTIEESRVFIHDNAQIVLDFQKTGTAAASNSDLAHRYLWGNAVDQLLADETVDDGSEDDVAYVLADHLNSVRDLVVYDPITGTVSVVKHVMFDAFGNVTSDSATGVLTLFRYTARPFDVDAELQNNLNRWYDLSTGRWMSVDPIGFEAGDVNLYRYVGNLPTNHRDPRGLVDVTGFTKFDEVFRQKVVVLPLGDHQYMYVYMASGNFEAETWESSAATALPMLQEYEPDATWQNMRGFFREVAISRTLGITPFVWNAKYEVYERCPCDYRISVTATGVLASVVMPNGDPLWRDPDQSSRIEQQILDHERNHFASYEAAYRILVAGLDAVEHIEFCSETLADAYVVKVQAEENRFLAALDTHQKGYDGPIIIFTYQENLVFEEDFNVPPVD